MEGSAILLSKLAVTTLISYEPTHSFNRIRIILETPVRTASQPACPP